MGYLRESQKGDAAFLSTRLRAADTAEIKALTGVHPSWVLQGCAESSEKCWTMCIPDGTPVGIIGRNPVYGEDNIAWIWMVCTDELPKHSIEFLRKSKAVIDDIHGPYDLLTNHADERNTLHLKWLKWLGFSFLRRIPKHGAEGRPFIEFARLKQCV